MDEMDELERQQPDASPQPEEATAAETEISPEESLTDTPAGAEDATVAENAAEDTPTEGVTTSEQVQGDGDAPSGSYFTASYSPYAEPQAPLPPPRRAKRAPWWRVLTCVILLGGLVFAAGYGLGALRDSDGKGNGTSTDPLPGGMLPGTNIVVEQSPAYVPADEPGTPSAVAEAVGKCVVQICAEDVLSYGQISYTERGSGSGVLFARDETGTYTYILTNNHVVEGYTSLMVLVDGRDEYEATVVGTDWMTDLAVLCIRASDLPLARFNVENAQKLGQEVAVLGYPLGMRFISLSAGVVSCLSRSVTVGGVPMTVMQTDAAMSPGNSGGGLFDMAGNLIGIICAKSMGDGVEGIGFSIPMATAWDVATAILQYGYVPGRPDFGLQVSEVESPSLLSGSSTYLRIESYAYGAELGSGAQIEAGDILEAINGKTVNSLTDLHGALANLHIGDTATVSVLRSTTSVVGGRSITTQKRVTLQLKVHAYAPPANP